MPELLSQQKDDVLVVQFTSPKILSDVLIAQIGRELLELGREPIAPRRIAFLPGGQRFASLLETGVLRIMHVPQPVR